MEFLPIINQIVDVLWYLIPIAILAGILKSPWFKGVVGEFIVNYSAKLLLDKEKYHLIKNVTLPTEDGSTQIDHIIVSEFGVFVVETKHMKGWIFGSPNKKIWTQKIYEHSNKFKNPLHQNFKHVKTLESLLGLNEQQVHSVIIFVGDSTFKTEMPENVTYGGGYARYIKSKNTPVLTESQVMEIISKIEKGRLTPSFKTNREHVRHVKSIVAEKESNNIPSCPKCGSSMVLRETKKGQNIGKKFWGCAKFPQCRGILNIT
jgi:restriction system protein